MFKKKDTSMPENVIAEVLAAHAQHMADDTTDSQDYLYLFPTHEAELAPLLRIAERVKTTLMPVEPSPEFEAALRRDLLAAALERAEDRKRKKRRLLLGRRKVLIGAVLGSAISVAGIVAAVLWWQRSAARA
jgi:hypothetical protein